MAPFILMFLLLGGGEKEILLPQPAIEGEVSVEEAIKRRRSVRSFKKETLSNKEISQLLWSAQGITDTLHNFSFRAAPSAGALYPLEVYIVIKEGIYHYIPVKHKLVLVKKGDFRKKLAKAALGQSAIYSAPLDFVITAVYDRTTIKYSERGIRYVHIEAGHVAENIQLQAVALDLGSVPIGAFYDNKVKNVIGCSKEEVPLYIIPVGIPSQ
ncbi:SagB/ThcOx family dehydrogenase [candidate division WOR-3 bacterium]|nr:SagB/ThcOx family dehydrogenase [candidate division WOR-3 bacterium]